MKALSLAMAVLASPLLVFGDRLEEMVAVRSRGGGQFIVHGTRADFGKTAVTTTQSGIRPVRLDPSLLVVTCDRIKQALMKELDCPDRWRGKIHIYIRPMPAAAPVVIDSAFYSDAWQGRMTVPGEIEASKLVRAVVQALLLEIANRVPGQYTSEIPLWLSEGLTQVLLAKQGPGLVLEGQSRMIRVETRTDPLAGTRARLNQAGVVSFNDLSFPEAGQLAPNRWSSFADSACLLVSELARLPNGRGILLGFISGLPRHLNWQSAFFAAFSAYFQQPLDVEKWWALAAATLAGRELGLTWPVDLSLDRLDAALRVPVQVRHAADLLPVASTVSLQQFLEQWDYGAQAPWVQQKVNQLRWLQANVSPAIASLVGGYSAALEDYLQKRRQTTSAHAGRRAGTSQPQLWTQSAVEKLNKLDVVRRNWRAESKSNMASQPAR